MALAEGYNPETGHTRLTKIEGEWIYVTERDYVEMNSYDDGNGNGVLRWKSNNRVVPYGVLRDAGYDADFIAKSQKVEDKELGEFMADYIENQKQFEADKSDEAMAIKRERDFERRAAFGEGAEVVDVFSGQKYQT